MGLRELILGNYEQERTNWNQAVAGITVPGTKDTADFLIAGLEKQLDRAVAAVSANETKASLIIPAIGAIVGITGVKLNTERLADPLLIAITALGVLAGAVAVVLAALVLSGRSRSNGPDPIRIVKGVGLAEEKARLNYIKSLGFAVQSSQQASNAKSFYLNWSLRALAVSVILIVILAGLGGFEAPAAGGGS
jgi:hypothetical protein